MKTNYRKQVSALMKANPIKPAGKARKKTVRTLGQASQRPHKTGAGTVSRKATPRLMARRKKDTIAGYYPNPINQGAADQLLQIAQGFIDKAQNYTSREAIMHATGVAYGIIMSLERYGEITSTQAHDTFSAIRKLTK